MAIARRAAGAGILLLAVACTGGSAAPDGIRVATGLNVVQHPVEERGKAPSFTGPSIEDGSPITDAVIAGKVGVVNFWGSWCGPCRKEQPGLEALWKEYGSRGVAFLGINTRRDQKAAALAYLEEFSVTYPSIYDPASGIAADFRVRVMPATFVVDRQGRIAATFLGAVRNEVDLRLILDAELER